MTCIVPFATKKALREAIERNPASVAVKDPSMFTTKPYFPASEIVGSIEVTNHPKRSWFAQIKWVKGKLKVL